MKKNEKKSHLRSGLSVSYFTCDDVCVIPEIIKQVKNKLESEDIFKLNILQTKVESNYKKYEKIREQSRVNKQRRKRRLLKEAKNNG